MLIASEIASESGPLDTVAGLPVHPLAVHVPVVLLPLAALGILALVVARGWRRPLAWPLLGVLLVGTVGAVVARQSGEALEDRLGSPGAHEDWGTRLMIASIVLLVLGGLWLLLVRRDAAGARATAREEGSSGAAPGRTGSAARALLGALAAAASLAVLALTVVTGHTGSEAAWKERLEDAARAAPATGGSTPETASGATGTQPAGPSGASSQGAADRYTTAQVAEHNGRTSCWTVVQGEVYDVTGWIARHPGGPARIEGLCGTDGSARFTDKHGEAQKPNSTLAGFKIGTLTD